VARLARVWWWREDCADQGVALERRDVATTSLPQPLPASLTTTSAYHHLPCPLPASLTLPTICCHSCTINLLATFLPLSLSLLYLYTALYLFSYWHRLIYQLISLYLAHPSSFAHTLLYRSLHRHAYQHVLPANRCPCAFSLPPSAATSSPASAAASSLYFCCTLPMPLHL